MALAQQVVGAGVIATSTAATSAMAVVKPPYDSLLISNPASGVVATVTFPATPGKRWMVDFVNAELFAISLVATPVQTSAIQVLDNAVEIFRGRLVTPVVALNGMAISNFHEVNLAITGSVGNPVTVRFNPAPNANGNESLAVGAYLI